MIRGAKTTDLKEIMEIVDRVKEEMHSYGNFQWDDSYPQARDFLEDIEKGELYVLVREERVAGFICINHDEPIEYKALDWSSTEDALVIHRMAVSPGWRKDGIGAELVAYAEELAMKSGVKVLKTDTYSINTKAQRLFLGQGYSLVGEMSFFGKEKPFYCYEKTFSLIG